MRCMTSVRGGGSCLIRFDCEMVRDSLCAKYGGIRRNLAEAALGQHAVITAKGSPQRGVGFTLRRRVAVAVAALPCCRVVEARASHKLANVAANVSQRLPPMGVPFGLRKATRCRPFPGVRL